MTLIRSKRGLYVCETFSENQFDSSRRESLFQSRLGSPFKKLDLALLSGILHWQRIGGTQSQVCVKPVLVIAYA